MSQPERIQELRQKIRRRKPKKAGTIAESLAIQWQAIEAARISLMMAEELGNYPAILTAVHAVTQANVAFVRMMETVDLEKRITALEAAEAARTNPGMKRVA